MSIRRFLRIFLIIYLNIILPVPDLCIRPRNETYYVKTLNAYVICYTYAHNRIRADQERNKQRIHTHTHLLNSYSIFCPLTSCTRLQATILRRITSILLNIYRMLRSRVYTIIILCTRQYSNDRLPVSTTVFPVFSSSFPGVLHTYP